MARNHTAAARLKQWLVMISAGSSPQLTQGGFNLRSNAAEGFSFNLFLSLLSYSSRCFPTCHTSNQARDPQVRHVVNLRISLEIQTTTPIRDIIKYKTVPYKTVSERRRGTPSASAGLMEELMDGGTGCRCGRGHA